MARTFTRPEFYDLIWSKAVSQLAKDFRLSDVAIHKICRKHNVPTPPPGWWAKKHAGQPVEPTPLPEPGKAAIITISAPEICAEPDVLSRIREEARITATAAKPNRAVIKHPIVEATIAALKAAEPSFKGLVSVAVDEIVRCEIAPASINRVKLILQRLVAAAEDQDFELRQASRSPHFVGHGHSISISITETFRRVKHVPTAKEQAALAAWEKRNNRRKLSWEWGEHDSYPRMPEWDYLLSDQLGIELSSVYIPGERSPRSTWRDGKTQRLEEITADIAVGMVVLAAAKTEAKRLHDEAEEQRRQARLKREMPFRLKYIAQRRSEGLDGVLDDMVKLAHFRQLIGQLRSNYAADADQPRVAEFLTWAEDELISRESGLSPGGLEQRFGKANLFGDDDDHDFVAPRVSYGW